MAGRASNDARQTDNWLWSRRDFFSLASWGALIGASGIMLAGFARFMYPRVLFEPTTVFDAGPPDDYPPNTVSERLVNEQRVWIAHQVDGDGTGWIVAISAVCTHLGCTPRWFAADNRFKCPCHGSGFRGFDLARGRDVLAVNYEGPAPRPLERHKVWIGDDGHVWVDRGVRFFVEKGEADHADAKVRAASVS